MKRRLLWALAAAIMFSGACQGGGDSRQLTEPEAWQKARETQTIEEFEAYLNAYPAGENSLNAKRLLRELWDEKVKSLTTEDLTRLTAVIETEIGKGPGAEPEKGSIKFKFHARVAPLTSRNFVKLAMSHFYDGLTFHRVAEGFIIQGGCPEGTGMGGPGYTIPNEFNDRQHSEGTVAMARKPDDPNSAGSQFYITLSQQPDLDRQWTVFGQVIEGLETVRAIAKVPAGENYQPLHKVVMTRVYIEGL